MSVLDTIRKQKQRQQQLDTRKKERLLCKQRIDELQNKIVAVDEKLTTIEEPELIEQKLLWFQQIEELKAEEEKRIEQFQSELVELDSVDMRNLRGVQAMKSEMRSRSKSPVQSTGKTVVSAPSAENDRKMLQSAIKKLHSQKSEEKPTLKQLAHCVVNQEKIVNKLKELQKTIEDTSTPVEQQFATTKEQEQWLSELDLNEAYRKQLEERKAKLTKQNTLTDDEVRVLRGRQALNQLPVTKDVQLYKQLKQEYTEWLSTKTKVGGNTPELHISTPARKQSQALEAHQKNKWALTYPSYLRILMKSRGLEYAAKSIDECKELKSEDRVRATEMLNSISQKERSDHYHLREQMFRRSVVSLRSSISSSSPPSPSSHSALKEGSTLFQQDSSSVVLTTPPITPMSGSHPPNTTPSHNNTPSPQHNQSPQNPFSFNNSMNRCNDSNNNNLVAETSILLPKFPVNHNCHHQEQEANAPKKTTGPLIKRLTRVSQGKNRPTLYFVDTGDVTVKTTPVNTKQRELGLDQHMVARPMSAGNADILFAALKNKKMKRRRRISKYTTK